MITWMSPGASRIASASPPLVQVMTRYSRRSRSWTERSTSGSSSTTRSVGRRRLMTKTPRSENPDSSARLILREAFDQGHLVAHVVVLQFVDQPLADQEAETARPE